MRKKHKKPLIRKRAKGKPGHARARFRQRYGWDIDNTQMQALVELAEANKVQSVVTDKHGHKKVQVRVGSELFRFVYNPENRQILTFLPTK